MITHRVTSAEACKDKRLGRINCPESDHKEAPMDELYYIGLDLHKKIIAYCIKKTKGDAVNVAN